MKNKDWEPTHYFNITQPLTIYIIFINNKIYLKLISFKTIKNILKILTTTSMILLNKNHTISSILLLNINTFKIINYRQEKIKHMLT